MAIKKLLFITTGDIKTLATVKRAIGMGRPLTEQGVEVHIVLQNSEENRKRVEMECPEVRCHFFEPASRTEEIRFKAEVINRICPDAIYVVSFGLRNYIRKSRIRSCQPLWMVEFSELLSKNYHIPFWQRMYQVLMERIAIREFDVFVMASKYLFYYFDVKYKLSERKRMLYLPYAFNDAVLKVAHKRKEQEIAQKLVYIGTLSLNYGFLLLIQAAHQLIAEGENVVLHIAGSGRHRAIGEDYIKQNRLQDKVSLEGYVPEEELDAFLQSADVFIAPLLNTVQDKARCPSKLFLYLPYQKPIITCRIGEAFELFGHDGLYYEANNLGSLVSAIRRGLDLEKQDYQPEKHTWHTRSREFLKFFND